MDKFGLIGNPINHSLSPLLFEAAYPEPAMKYDLIQADTSAEALSIFKKEYKAVNVTAPFKEDAFHFADNADTIATAIEAANILVKEGDMIKAYNSDCLAVTAIIHSFEKQGVLNKSEDGILIVGCGGAGKAAAYASAISGFVTDLVNRDFSKAERFCDKIDCLHPYPLCELATLASKAKMVIYTVPAALPEICVSIHPNALVLEANYRSPILCEPCSKTGATYISGKEWLIEQALAGFKLMTGKEPDEFGIRARQI